MAEKDNPAGDANFKQMAQDALTRALAKQQAKSAAKEMTEGLMKRLKPEGNYKKGGPVKKTGIYKLHKGEHVLSASKVKSIKAKVKAVKPVGAGKHKLGSKLSTAEILKGALK